MKKIERVVVVMPVAKEPPEMIFRRRIEIEEVRGTLRKSGVTMSFFWLDDAAANLPEDEPCLVRHDKNLGLATTLFDAFGQVVNGRNLKAIPDVIVRLDAQEHNVYTIPDAVEQLRCTEARAVYVPIMYCRANEPRRRAIEATAIINELVGALKPTDVSVIGRIYNQVFPLGYQVYETSLLAEILPAYQRVMELFQTKFGQRATWGMDLVALVLAAQRAPIDVIFRDYSEPWESNRLEGHVQNQRDRVTKMLSVLSEHAAELGLVMA